MAASNYPLGKKGSIIGTPYKGTHAVGFNAKGGSNNWESENAYDIEVPVGTPVYALASGTIGSQIGPGGSGRFAGDRLHLVTKGNEFYYAHMSSLVVKAGEKVQAGQLLGYSGEANGVGHLHIAARKGNVAAYFAAKPQGGASVAPAVPQDPTQTVPGVQNDPTQPVVPQPGQMPSPQTQPDIGSTLPYQPAPASGINSTNQFVAELWNRIASQPASSPDTQLLAQNAQYSSGG